MSKEDEIIKENLRFFLDLPDIDEYDGDYSEFIPQLMELAGCTQIEAKKIINKFWNDLQDAQNEYDNNRDANKPKCPTCSSTNIQKISSLSKAGSVAMFGIFSQKVKRQFHCNNCGYEW